MAELLTIVYKVAKKKMINIGWTNLQFEFNPMEKT